MVTLSVTSLEQHASTSIHASQTFCERPLSYLDVPCTPKKSLSRLKMNFIAAFGLSNTNGAYLPMSILSGKELESAF